MGLRRRWYWTGRPSFRREWNFLIFVKFFVFKRYFLFDLCVSIVYLISAFPEFNRCFWWRQRGRRGRELCLVYFSDFFYFSSLYFNFITEELCNWRIKWVKVSALGLNTSMEEEDWARFSKFRSSRSSNPLLSAKSARKISTKWKNAFICPSFANSKLILNAFESASPPDFNIDLSISSEKMRLACYSVIPLVCLPICGHFRNFIKGPGAGVIVPERTERLPLRSLRHHQR